MKWWLIVILTVVGVLFVEYAIAVFLSFTWGYQWFLSS